ncbi:MAG: diacylglycerol kinase [Actinomycetota bacterium]|nr:diacylglycerol kinase [Actinomycetota bacterium]
MVGPSGSPERFGRALLVVNSVAGGVSDAIVHEVADRCQARLDAVSTMHTTHADAGVALLAEAMLAADRRGAPIDLVIAVGGDGTVREIAEGLARGVDRWPSGGASGGAPRLFIVPAGSGNSAYHALWGERPWRDALEAILCAGDYRVRNIDLLRLVESDRAALLGVNTGLIARIAALIEQKKAEERSSAGAQAPAAAQEADEVGEQRYWAALGEALQDLEPFLARVTVDGETVHEGPATLVTVGGVRRFGRGSFELLPRSVLDDALLDVCAVGELTSQGIAELAALVPAGEHLGRPGVAYAQGRRVTVERTDGERLLIEHDGDPRDAEQIVTLDVVPGAVPALTAVEAPPG